MSTHMESEVGKRDLASMEASSADGDHPATERAGCTRTSASEQGDPRWLDIFKISLGQADKGRWYDSTLELQLASFEFCVACRVARTVCVTVDKDMPLSLWGVDEYSAYGVEATDRRRLPSLQAGRVIWDMPTDMLVPVLSESTLFRGVTSMRFIDEGNQGWYAVNTSCGDSDAIVWPQTLVNQMLSPRRFFEAMLRLVHLAGTEHVANVVSPPQRLTRLWGCLDPALRWSNLANARGVGFQHPICHDSWSAFFPRMALGWINSASGQSLASHSSIEELTRGKSLHQLIGWMNMPASLLKLELEGNFSQPITGVIWPPSLLKLTLGGHFNQPIAGIAWPATLRNLIFNGSFNQRITGIVGPATLRRLKFGSAFNQPIVDITWPASLLELSFGFNFNHEITATAWPVSLKKLSFGDHFNQPLTGVAWPASLKWLKFKRGFNLPIHHVAWPAGLESLEFRGEFDQVIEGVAWPASLLILSFGSKFNQPIAAVQWPPFLEYLSFRDDFNQPIAGIKWPAPLRYLRFGKKFSHSIDWSAWPDPRVATVHLPSGCIWND